MCHSVCPALVIPAGSISSSEIFVHFVILRSDEELQEECGSLKAERDENQSDDDLSDFKNEMKDIEQVREFI